MPDFDPKAPLNELEKRVFGADSRRHPITDVPIQRGSGALSVEQQARQHLSTIVAEHGIAFAREIERKLNEFEAAGGKVVMPAPYTNPELSRKG